MEKRMKKPIQINFNNYKSQMTEKDLDEIHELLAKGCRKHNRDLLWLRLTTQRSLIPEYGIMNRLIKDTYGWHYCAGQSYPDEIRTVRKIILELR